jgi:hypothetical protein
VRQIRHMIAAPEVEYVNLSSVTLAIYFVVHDVIT